MRKISRSTLSPGIKEAIRDMRYRIGAGRSGLREYGNGSSPYLPNAGTGNAYYEYDVGSGRIDRGRARIVGLFGPDGTMLACYFTNTHYGSWMEIINI